MTLLKLVLKVALVCLAFGVCFAVGGALAGVARLVASESRLKSAEAGMLLPYSLFCVTVGTVVSCLVLRSGSGGIRLAIMLFVATYGISTIAPQVESLFFLSAKLPHGVIRALFEQGAIAMALFTAMAMSILGKWRSATATVRPPEPPIDARGMTCRLVLLVLIFVFLYMWFGYFVAWRNPALRAYYGGTDYANFYEALKSNWQREPLLFCLQVFRALLYVACLYPLLRTLLVPRWGKAVAASAFLASWTTALLLPNPLMPASVTRSHFWETLGFNLVFGALMGWLTAHRSSRPEASAITDAR